MPACAKPERGSGKLERLARKTAKAGITARLRHRKQLAHVQSKRAIKAQVRELDQHACRWPECDVPPTTIWGQIDVAHVQAEGMGGNPSLDRTTLENCFCLCKWHHTGPQGLHSGLARVELLTEQGTRGAVLCMKLEKGEAGRWLVVGISEPPKLGDEEGTRRVDAPG